MLKVRWIDSGREPKCKPDPDFPTGMDVNLTSGDKGCEVDLPYPAPRCGVYIVRCDVCDCSAAISTAGRPDDPRSVTLPCKVTKH